MITSITEERPYVRGVHIVSRLHMNESSTGISVLFTDVFNTQLIAFGRIGLADRTSLRSLMDVHTFRFKKSNLTRLERAGFFTWASRPGRYWIERFAITE